MRIERQSLNDCKVLILVVLRVVEADGMSGVAVKCIDTTWNTDCEGSLLRYI